MSDNPRETIRPATPDDIPSLVLLVRCATRELAGADYTRQQIDSALRGYGTGVDLRLIDDGTYYVAEIDGRIVGAGGWSFRPAMGPDPIDGGHPQGVGDERLDPARDAARIRAFFVHPDYARRGIARRILAVCESAAWRAGFRRLELVATRTGVPLYVACGFESIDWIEVPLPDGVKFPVMRMKKTMEPVPVLTQAAQPALVATRDLRQAGRALGPLPRSYRFFTPGL